jgi:hypothetical protein
MAATPLFGLWDWAGTRRKQRVAPVPEDQIWFPPEEPGVISPPHPRGNQRLMIPSGPVWPPGLGIPWT